MLPRHSVLFPKTRHEQGSGLIWFISVIALVCLLIGVLVSASSQFLAARQVTDISEQYVLSLKTQLNSDLNSSIDSLARNLFAYVAPKYHLDNLHVKSLQLEQGQTVHAVVCITWQAPLTELNIRREICEEAYAR